MTSATYTRGSPYPFAVADHPPSPPSPQPSSQRSSPTILQERTIFARSPYRASREMIRKRIELAEANVKTMRIFFFDSTNIYTNGTTYSGLNSTNLNFTRVSAQRVNGFSLIYKIVSWWLLWRCIINLCVCELWVIIAYVIITFLFFYLYFCALWFCIRKFRNFMLESGNTYSAQSQIKRNCRPFTAN